MGKRVLVSLLALAAIFVSARTGGAQDDQPATETAPAFTFEPGEFLTADDYEYLKSALDCINLKPADLDYEKKQKPKDILRLKVCDAALDHPLGVPRTAEIASHEFSSTSAPTRRCIHAAKLLDQPTTRWSAQELKKDGARYEKLSAAVHDASKRLQAFKGDKDGDDYKRLKADADSARQHLNEAINDALYGETPRALLPDTSLEETGLVDLGGKFFAAADALTREGWHLSGAEKTELAAELGGLMGFDRKLIIPGGKAPADEDNYNVFEQGGKIDIAPTLVTAGRVWSILEAEAARYTPDVQARKEWAKGTADHKVPGVTGNVVAAWQSKWGKVVIGGTGPNTYEGDDFIGIIDLGGDDLYKGRVACGVGLDGHAPISFVLDLSGNDRYEGGDFTQGFGYMGVGILMDLGKGDDTYKAGACAQGCGLGGYGELYDDGGDDSYNADSGAQGAGCFGYGQLTDLGGEDTYRGALFVQGFAEVMGVGVLTDAAGNDLYYAGGKYLHKPLFNDRYESLSQGFAFGNRNDAGIGTGGGVALLLDEGDGNDFYNADIFGQGASYWYALGMLVDKGGNDNYTLGQYGMGGGIHLSTGILVDLKGNDTYTNPYGVGLGGSHDWSVGWLIDRAGNDLYQGNGQGQGLNFAIGILLDCGGKDSHCTNNEGSVGKGVNNDISLMLDLGGEDSYGPKEIKDGQFTRRGNHELVYDVPPNWFPGVDTSTLPTVQDPPPDHAVVQHILISWKDASGRVTPKDPERTKEQAEKLRDKVLKLARTKGADWSKLQEKYNEDAEPHHDYAVGKDDDIYVKEFKNLALKLGVGQIDWCETKFGFHIMKRIS